MLEALEDDDSAADTLSDIEEDDSLDDMQGAIKVRTMNEVSDTSTRHSVRWAVICVSCRQAKLERFSDHCRVAVIS